MKNFLKPVLFPLALMLPFFSEECEKAVEIAVPVATNIPFKINSTNAAYSAVETVNFTRDVEKAIAEAQLDDEIIVDIKIESVAYTVMNVNGATNMLLNGLLRVGPVSLNDPIAAELLGQITDVDLNQIVDQEQVPALDSTGVKFLNERLRKALITKTEDGVFKAFIDGQVKPAPSPSLDFLLTARVNLTVVILEKVEVPGGCSNPLQ
jgi:hypothetical protein